MIRTSLLSKSTLKTITATVVRQSHSQAKTQTPGLINDKCHHYNEAEGHYRSSPFEPVEIPSMKIHEYVWQNLHKYENNVAVVSTSEIDMLDARKLPLITIGQANISTTC